MRHGIFKILQQIFSFYPWLPMYFDTWMPSSTRRLHKYTERGLPWAVCSQVWVCECGRHISKLRQKEKQAGASHWGSHLQLLPLLLAESFYLKQTESWKQHFKWLAISKLSCQNTDLLFKHVKEQASKVHSWPWASLLLGPLLASPFRTLRGSVFLSHGGYF